MLRWWKEWRVSGEGRDTPHGERKGLVGPEREVRFGQWMEGGLVGGHVSCQTRYWWSGCRSTHQLRGVAYQLPRRPHHTWSRLPKYGNKTFVRENNLIIREVNIPVYPLVFTFVIWYNIPSGLYMLNSILLVLKIPSYWSLKLFSSSSIPYSTCHTLLYFFHQIDLICSTTNRIQVCKLSFKSWIWVNTFKIMSIICSL